MRTLRDYLIIFSVIGIMVTVVMNYIILPAYVNWNDEIRVPSLTFITLEDADKILKTRQLEWTIKDTIFRNDIEPYFVVDQFPEAGQMVKEHRRVQLTISLPPPKYEMPNLIARTERQARIALDELGLVLYEVLRDSSDYYEKTVVSSQSITPGMSVAIGDSIQITVSLGKRNLKKTMPDLLNKGLDEAQLILNAKGFELGNVSYLVDTDLLPHTIVSQSVPAGKIFPKERIVYVDLIITTVE